MVVRKELATESGGMLMIYVVNHNVIPALLVMATMMGDNVTVMSCWSCGGSAEAQRAA